MRVAVEFEALGALPKGWSWQPLQNLTDNPRRDIVDGPFGSNLKASEYVDQGVPIARLQNVDRNQFIDKNIRCVTEHKAADLIRHRFEPGDVLLTKLGDPLGKACIVPPAVGSGVIVADLVRIRPSAGRVDLKYLAYALNSPAVIRQLERHTKGTTRPRVNLGVVRELPIPVAPRDQQESVVAEIEKQFSRLDEAVANLKRVKANLKRYKAAVLKAAVEGRLVPTEAELARRGDRSYETGSQLLQRILETRRSQWKGTGKYKAPAALHETDLPSVPAGWTRATLDQIGQEGRPIIYGIIKPGPHVPGGVPYVRVTEMKDGFVDIANLRRAAAERAAKFARATLAAGDVLISKDGTIGRVAVVPPALEGGNITQHVMRVPVTSEMDRSYVVWAIRSDFCQRWLTGETRGVALRGVNVEDFRRLPIPVPPVAEQRRIAEEIDSRLSVVAEVGREVEANENRVAALRAASLAMNFQTDVRAASATSSSSRGRARCE